MFCLTHLTPSVIILKVFSLVLAAALAATLEYPDSMKRKNVAGENHSELDSLKTTAIPDYYRHLSKTELLNMSASSSDKESSHNISQHTEKINLNDSKNQKNKENNDSSVSVFKMGSIKKTMKDCDKICLENAQKNNLQLIDIHAVNVIGEGKTNLKMPIVQINLSSADVQGDDSKLAQRDVSDSYELDNYENHRDISAMTAFSKDNRSSTLYLKNVKVTDSIPNPYEHSQSLSSLDEVSSQIPISEDQSTDHVFSNVSNNRTVGFYDNLSRRNSTSVYDSGKVDVKLKPIINQTDVAGTVSDGEKLSKPVSKNLSKAYKNKTSQEVKTLTKNIANSQIKYSEESKRKALIKTLNDDSLENFSLQQASVIHGVDPVSLMNDEPEDSSGIDKGHGAVLIPEDESSESLQQVNGTINIGVVNATILETNETFPSTAHGHTMKSSDGTTGFYIAIISGIAVSILVVSSVIGAISFVVYRHRYWNKPQTLSDKCSNADSSGYIDDSTLRDNSEEMYSLDNDSFLNSLEAMTIQNYWTDNVKHTKL